MERKPRYIFLPFIFSNKIAVCIFPFIFWSKRKRGWFNPCIVAHEVCHWNHQKKWKEEKIFGLSRWLAKYILYWLIYNVIKTLPPQQHPMEKPAYEAQYQCEKDREG